MKKYPIFKKHSEFQEFDVILDSATLFSIRNGDVLAFGTVSNASVVEKVLEFEDSTREEFELALSNALERLRETFSSRGYGRLFLENPLHELSPPVT